MDFLKNLIKEKREEIRQKVGDKRCFQKSDLIDINKFDIPVKKIKGIEENAKRYDKDLTKAQNNSSSDIKLSKSKIINILRSKKEPIRCFGESDNDVYQRMKLIQLIEPSIHSSNDLIAAKNKVDEDEAMESYRLKELSKPVKNSLEAQIKIISENIDDRQLRKMRRYLSSYCLTQESITSLNRQYYNVSTDEDEDGQNDIDELSEDLKNDEISVIDKICDYVIDYLKYILAVWLDKLNKRSKEEKSLFRGKDESLTYNTTINYLQPLIKIFEKRNMSADILDSMVKITALLLDRNYLKATEAYFELSIGNAPWPLGVTNHGIHARTAQEKIHTKNVAHVLNDETQRKYLHAIKRLITRAQMYFPTIPSRCVNYDGPQS